MATIADQVYSDLVRSWDQKLRPHYPLGGAPIPPPSGITVTSVSASTLKVSFTDNTNGVAAHLIEVSSTNFGAWSPVALLDPGVTEWNLQDLDPGTRRYFRLKSNYGGVYSSYSQIVGAVTAIDNGGSDAQWPENVIEYISFEDGHLNGPYPSGFIWTSSSSGPEAGENPISIVRDDQYIIWQETGPVPIGPVPGKSWDAVDGRHALRFKYGPNATGEDAWPEQRFQLGAPKRELWIGFWLKVPPNFYHRYNESGAENNKLFAIWMDGYSDKGLGPTVIWEWWPDGEGGSDLAVHYAEGGIYTTANSHVQHTDFIRIPVENPANRDDRGRWMQLIFRVVAATDYDSNDGIIEMWRKWEGSSNWTKFHELTDADIGAPPNPNGWDKGYLMGWSNSGFTNETDVLLDGLVFSEFPLADGLDYSGTGVSNEVIAYDSFESGDLSYSPASGFQWTSSPGDTAVDVGAAKTGSHSLRFTYPTGENGWAEQRFEFGQPMPEAWLNYWVRVPDNWTHGISGPAGNNNKFFALWMDEYENTGPTGVIQIRGTAGNSYISPYVRTRANVHLGELPGKTLIRIPEDRGRWMQIVVHAKMATSAGSGDGVWEMFRRWDGDTTYESIFRVSDWDNYHVGGQEGFAKGYILGWFNADQPASTTWYIDDFTVSSSDPRL